MRHGCPTFLPLVNGDFEQSLTKPVGWAVVELCSHLMTVVGQQLSARGEKVASRILQVQLFRAITKQELPWLGDG